jgi:hypothetical protein
MDALTEQGSEAPIKSKREPHNKRLKRRLGYLAGDIAALERLVGTLLNRVERATEPEFTDQERAQYRAMVSDIRKALSEGEAEGKLGLV